MKVAELSGALLDYWVLRAEGWVDDRLHDMQLTRNGEYCIAGVAPMHAVSGHCWRSPSTDWAVGGPIVESERIWLSDEDGRWLASCPPHADVDNGKDLIQFGETPLIAAMRAKVASRYGDEVTDV